MIMNYLILFLAVPVVVVRLLRWTALWQQKEYRLDRLWIYLKSDEGMGEWSQFWHVPMRLSQVKRPVRTVKAMFVFLTALVVSVYGLVSASSIWGILLVYIFCPIVIFLAVPPAWLATEAVKRYLIWRSRRKINKFKPKIIGITGSYGKTTTRKLAAALLKEKFQVWTPPASHNTPLAVAKDIVNTYKGEELVLIEYAAYKVGEIARMCIWLPPQAAVFTGLTFQHLGLFGTLENLKRAKSELIEAIPEKGLVVYNSEDMEVKKLMDGFENKNLSFSAVKQLPHMVNEDGQLAVKMGTRKVTTKLIGQHYAMNVAMAVRLAKQLKVSYSQIATGLVKFNPDKNFICGFRLKSGAMVIDDGGTSNPVGFSAAIKLADGVSRREQKILITGGIIDLGDKSMTVHEKLTREAKRVFDYVVYIGETEKAVWQSVFGDRLKDASDLPGILRSTNKRSLVLIEGKMPKQVINILREFSI